jgi:phosphoserine phosphatase
VVDMSLSQNSSIPTHQAQDVPIAVDLDGTLTPIDTLYELIFKLAYKSPFYLLLLLLNISKGKANLKKQIANKVNCNPATIPYNTELIAWLNEQRNIGRKIILCTGANIKIAKIIYNIIMHIFNYILNILILN